MVRPEQRYYPLKFDYDSTGTLVTLTSADHVKDRRLVLNNFPFFFCISVEYVKDNEHGTLDRRIKKFVTFYLLCIFIYFFPAIWFWLE